MIKILIRFDDICSTMDFRQFEHAHELLEQYGIKPLLGVIPDCADPELLIEPEHDDFWDYIKCLQEKGYKIAMHGYQHVYDTECRGMVNMNYRSEFAGHSFEEQYRKIRNGKEIFSLHGIETDIFFAPSHSYDKNTLKALAACGFRYVSDGMAMKPIERYGILCIPCRSPGVPRIKRRGYYTAVFHAHEWVRPEKAHGFGQLKDLCSNYAKYIVDFDTYNDRKTEFPILWKSDEYIYVRYCRYLKPVLSNMKHYLLERVLKK